MRGRSIGGRGLLAATVALGLVAIMSSAGASQGSGTVRIAVNPWVGSEADYAVLAAVLQDQLGYTAERVDVAETPAWDGFETGQIDVIPEVWGHDAERALFIDQKGVAQDVGLMGVNGTIGWYVPGWMAEAYPDITDWHNLNKYATLFKTSKSGDKGQFLFGDPSYFSHDEAIIKNLGLDYVVVAGGGEPTLITQLQQATEQKTPLLAYFYDPQWALSQPPLVDHPLVKINLPTWTPECPTTEPEWNCDYQPFPLWKAVSTTFAQSGGPAYDLVRNFTLTNNDQSTIAAYISNDGMAPIDAGRKWVAENPDSVSSWLNAKPTGSPAAP